MMMMMRMRQAGTSQTAFGFSKCQTNYSNTSELPVVPCFNHCKITSFSMTLMANRQPLPPVPPLHTSFAAARNARRTHLPPGPWEVTYCTSNLVSLSKKPIPKLTGRLLWRDHDKHTGFPTVTVHKLKVSKTKYYGILNLIWGDTSILWISAPLSYIRQVVCLGNEQTWSLRNLGSSSTLTPQKSIAEIGRNRSQLSSGRAPSRSLFQWS